ncbi:hypothetical protein BLOT_014177 [Blomia tropicalis]|nr:hypothetical protein BLOT_014177 [Blomia tropicalis]
MQQICQTASLACKPVKKEKGLNCRQQTCKHKLICEDKTEQLASSSSSSCWQHQLCTNLLCSPMVMVSGDMLVPNQQRYGSFATKPINISIC